ncbi:dihydrodipicolinate synthase family protein [Streptomyces malaysiensis]|uniref:1-pyrroline-4-hydroxy-2-carboxylate deaminase n=1 Tax=Streptomyces malaysiensis TaxID=92644 RepID=A0A7X5WWH9_STRMQ|nr:dihydrodipicolinate synthase family protein [Streptomyces malaysiensis]NIY62266.1 1-pyrroline-4-hydroxy-2-carboxylate deaminase [Streptomyces malaysiensis]
MAVWHGIVVAAALPLKDDLSVDYDKVQEHVAWLAANGCDGVSPNGSLGEYQVLTPQERADVVRAAVEAAPEGFSVIPGTGAYGAGESRRWAEQALEAGAQGVLSLPPSAYRADEEEVVAHYREISKVGLPVIAYNNPFDTNVDLTPELIARVAEFDNIVAVKEFSGDVRRAHQIRSLAPRIDVLAGADDVLLELVLVGAKGWIGGFSNAFPRECRKLYDLAVAGNLAEALPLYQQVHDAFAWDSRHTFIQAIKLAMDMAGRHGGPVRLPRLPLNAESEARARKDFERAFAALSAAA